MTIIMRINPDGIVNVSGGVNEIGSGGEYGPLPSGTLEVNTLKEQGRLFACGRDNYGQLGIGEALNYPDMPDSLTGVGSDTWKMINGGEYFAVAIASDGTLWAWGRNHLGQLGQGNTSSFYSSPIQIGSGTTWKKCGAGWAHSIALKEDGTLWAWGSNGAGQLGQGNTNSPCATPVQITGSWAEADASKGDSSYAISANGTLWAWGAGAFGKLAQGGDTSNKSTPTQIGTSASWKSVGGGQNCAGGMADDNTVWSWGSNTAGQGGIPGGGWLTTPTQVGSSASYSKHIVGDWYHSLVIMDDGTLWAWGRNAEGQLGQGNTSSFYSSPIQVGTSATWAYASPPGYGHCLGTLTDGTLWTWGLNDYGQLGKGNTTSGSANYVPVIISISGESTSAIAGTSYSTFVNMKASGDIQAKWETGGDFWIRDGIRIGAIT